MYKRLIVLLLVILLLVILTGCNFRFGPIVYQRFPIPGLGEGWALCVFSWCYP